MVRHAGALGLFVLHVQNPRRQGRGKACPVKSWDGVCLPGLRWGGVMKRRSAYGQRQGLHRGGMAGAGDTGARCNTFAEQIAPRTVCLPSAALGLTPKNVPPGVPRGGRWR